MNRRNLLALGATGLSCLAFQRRVPSAPYPMRPVPGEFTFDDYFQANLAPYVMGYGYAVARNADIFAGGGGWARSPFEIENPLVAFTADTRMTLASVSKAITGVALETLSLQMGVSLDTPFVQILGNNSSLVIPVGNAADIERITLRHLATMMSGLYHETQGDEGPADVPSADNGDIWTEINNYLSMTPFGPPGVTYYYDNTNYAILQEVITQQSGMDYTDYVTQYVLTPAGMSVTSATPNQVEPTLTYSAPGDTIAGYEWGQFTLVGVSGWVSSARDLVKLMIALRGESVLPQSSVGDMFTGSIGWNLPGNPASGPAPYLGKRVPYYWKEGGLSHDRTGGQPSHLETFLVRLGEGYDLALLVNSATGSASIYDICYNLLDAVS